MKYIVEIFKVNNKYVAKCTELNIEVLGDTEVDVKQNFVQELILYSKKNNTFIDFVWEYNIDK